MIEGFTVGGKNQEEDRGEDKAYNADALTQIG